MKFFDFGLRISKFDFGLLILLSLISCGQREQRPAAADPSARIPHRIVSVVPNVTEMLFALGAGDRVVAVGNYDRFPPEVETRQRIGGLINPNIEKIIELKPDLVITYGSQAVLRDRLQSIGIRFLPFAHGSVDQTLSFIIELGRVVGAEERGRHIVDEIHRTFDELRRSAPAKKPKVLLLHNRGVGMLGSFYSVGSKAFQHELIEIAGGENLFGDVDREVLQPSLEEIISRGPDVIIETISPPGDPAEIAQRRQDWTRLPKLPAVAASRIYVVAEDYFLLPGPRFHVAARRFAELIRVDQ